MSRRGCGLGGLRGKLVVSFVWNSGWKIGVNWGSSVGKNWRVWKRRGSILAA